MHLHAYEFEFQILLNWILKSLIVENDDFTELNKAEFIVFL